MANNDDMRLIFNLTRFEMQYPNFVRTIGQKVADEEILKPIHSRMKNFGYSQKIIDSTRIENLQIDKLGLMTFDVVSDYKSETNFDVAKAREEGTVAVFVKPVIKKALSFIAGGFIRAFSKGHLRRGITASNVIEFSVDELTPIAQVRLNEETDNFLQRSLGN